MQHAFMHLYIIGCPLQTNMEVPNKTLSFAQKNNLHDTLSTLSVYAKKCFLFKILQEQWFV